LNHYYLLHKPYGYLSQFTREAPEHRVLGDLYAFPKEVYPVGRLDQDSEGLLLLTDDKKLNHLLLDPAYAHRRTYLVQVEGIPTTEALEQLRRGLAIKVGKQSYTTRPARAHLLAQAPTLPERDPPVRFRKTVPDAWLELVLTEGKNRQVRRMCAAVGFPVLRLVRIRIEGLALEGLAPGQVRELSGEEVYRAIGRVGG
jgi:23S rRNA pseudouridine2457 synthase